MTAHQAHAEVERLIAGRTPFCEIEDRINDMPLDDDHRAALWLLAWSEQHYDTRRRVVRETLTAVSRPQG